MDRTGLQLGLRRLSLHGQEPEGTTSQLLIERPASRSTECPGEERVTRVPTNERLSGQVLLVHKDRTEARWKGGDLPNWWSALGFELLSGRYQRKWHREAHRRMSRLVHEGAAHLVAPGIDQPFTYHRYWKDPL